MRAAYRRAGRLGPVVLLIVGLSACGEQANPSRADAEPTSSGAAQIDPKLLAEVDSRVQKAVDVAPQALTEVLARAASGGRAYGQTLVLPINGESIALDGWYTAQGLTQLAGAEYGEALWSLTERGSGFVQQTGSGWFVVKRGADAKVACRSGATVTQSVCDVAIPYEIITSPAGEQMVGKRPPFGFSLTATATTSPTGWELTDLRADEESPTRLVVNALLGPPEGREETRRSQLQAALQAYQAPSAARSQQADSRSVAGAPVAEEEPNDGVAEYQPD